MKTFNSFITEVTTVEDTKLYDELMKDFTDAFRKEFKTSWFEIKKARLGSGMIILRFIVGAKEDLVNGILQNDPFFSVISLDGVGSEKMGLEMSTGNRVVVNRKTTPSTVVKAGWRNKKGTKDQLLKHFGEYLKKLKMIIKDNSDTMESYLLKRI